MIVATTGIPRGKHNLEALNAWVAEPDARGDWGDYIRRGKLNRSELAIECGFASSALGSNPAVKARLKTLERLLADKRILWWVGITTSKSPDSAQNAPAVIDRRDQKINELEFRVAT